MNIVIDGRMIGSSGIGRYLRGLVKVLLRRGCVLAILGNPQEIRRYFPAGHFPAGSSPSGQVYIIDFQVSVYNPLSLFLLALKIPECDIYFSPHFTTTPFRTKARRRIATIHDTFHLSPVSGFNAFERIYARFLYASTLKISDLILTVSDDCRRSLLSAFGSGPDMRTVWNGVDMSVFYPDQASSPPVEGRYGLFVGNLKNHKRPGLAIDAAGLADIPGLRLAVLGSSKGQLHRADADTLQKLDSPWVIRLDAVDDGTLRALYSHARFLIFPTVHEGFGYPAIEAMACGCPVICSRIPVLEEVCGDAALYCTPDSVAEFSAMIRKLCLGDQERNEVIQKGFARASAFTMEAFEKAMESIPGVWDTGVPEALTDYALVPDALVPDTLITDALATDAGICKAGVSGMLVANLPVPEAPIADTLVTKEPVPEAKARYAELCPSPDLSMIIVNYGPCDMALACIASIRKVCTSVSFEIILVDSLSPFSEPNLARFTGLADLCLSLPDNRGYGHACNAGAQKARGKVLLFLNNDTVFEADFLEDLLSLVSRRDLKVGAAGIILKGMDGEPVHSYGSFPSIGNQMRIWFDNQGKKRKEKNWLHALLSCTEQHSPVDYITGAALFVPKTVFDAVGGFDERFFMYFEDVELQYRIRSAGMNVLLLHRTGLLHAEGNGKPRTNRTRTWTYESLHLYFTLKGRGRIRPDDFVRYLFMTIPHIFNHHFTFRQNLHFFLKTVITSPAHGSRHIQRGNP